MTTYWLEQGTGLYAHNLDLSTINIVESNYQKLSIYPNPVTDILHLSNAAMFKVYNILGELVYETNQSRSALFLTKRIDSGDIYYCRL